MYTEIALAITGVKNVLDTVKTLNELTKRSDRKGSEVEERQTVLSLLNQVEDLSSELRKLKTKLEERESIMFDDGHCVYWLKDKFRFGSPFCPKCFDVDQRLCRMQPYTGEQGLSYSCLSCKTMVYP